MTNDNDRWKMPRYTENLRVDDRTVYSYDTRVAVINHSERTVTALGWWSVTTSKHINYVASEYGYEVITGKDGQEELDDMNNYGLSKHELTLSEWVKANS